MCAVRQIWKGVQIPDCVCAFSDSHLLLDKEDMVIQWLFAALVDCEIEMSCFPLSSTDVICPLFPHMAMAIAVLMFAVDCVLIIPVQSHLLMITRRTPRHP